MSRLTDHHIVAILKQANDPQDMLVLPFTAIDPVGKVRLNFITATKKPVKIIVGQCWKVIEVEVCLFFHREKR